GGSSVAKNSKPQVSWVTVSGCSGHRPRLTAAYTSLVMYLMSAFDPKRICQSHRSMGFLPRLRAIDLRSSPIQSRRLSFICSHLLTGRLAGTSFFWSALSEEKEGTPKCSRRPPNQATSCQL